MTPIYSAILYRSNCIKQSGRSLRSYDDSPAPPRTGPNEVGLSRKHILEGTHASLGRLQVLISAHGL
jgi:hypothetical protein